MSIPERWRGHRPLPDDILERIERLRPLFDRHKVQLAYLFGSLARGEAADDVDLALLGGTRSPLDLWSELVQALGTDRLDLVDLRAAGPVLRFHIVREGRTLHRRDEETERAFELAAVREYRDSRHRRAIQDAYLADWAAG